MPEEMLPEVWVVDDSRSVRQALGSALGAAGLTVRLFEDGQACIAALPEAGNAFFIVDHTMPELDGLDVVRRIRSVKPRAPIVAITGRGNDALKMQYRKAGAIDVLWKPVDSEDLMAMVRASVNRP